ncbi:MAG: signal peptidase II [Dehalococcoidia bacterium]|nr:signal peptidase II [Dehalococcoidia bacterium]
MRRSFFLPAAVIASAIILDQLSKAWIRATLDLGESITVLGPLSLTRVANTGSVFGLGQGHIIIPTIGSIIVLALIPIALQYASSHYAYVPDKVETICIALVTGGAIGNLIDRIWLSSVTDFIDIEIARGIHWPMFNIADSCVVAGTIVLVYSILTRGASVAGDTGDE